VTHVSPKANYGITNITGIHVRSNDDAPRNVTNSLIENFYVKGVHQGVFYDCKHLAPNECDSSNPDLLTPKRVRLRNGIVSGSRNANGYAGNGIVLWGREHTSEGKLYVTDVEGEKLENNSANSNVTLSSTAPVLPINPACSL
jgi:hypothetical protein